MTYPKGGTMPIKPVGVNLDILKAFQQGKPMKVTAKPRIGDSFDKMASQGAMRSIDFDYEHKGNIQGWVGKELVMWNRYTSFLIRKRAKGAEITSISSDGSTIEIKFKYSMIPTMHEDVYHDVMTYFHVQGPCLKPVLEFPLSMIIRKNVSLIEMLKAKFLLHDFEWEDGIYFSITPSNILQFSQLS